jgi:hypothetical protein
MAGHSRPKDGVASLAYAGHPRLHLRFGCGSSQIVRKLPVRDPVPASAVLPVPRDQLNLEILLFVGQSNAPILLVQGNQLSATLVSRKPSR